MKKLLIAFMLLICSFTNTVSYSYSGISKLNYTMHKEFSTELDAYSYIYSNYNILQQNLPIGIPLDTTGFSRISDLYGIRKVHPVLGIKTLHKGIDFAGKKGTPVYPTAAGTVLTVRRSISYGKLIEIDHGNNVTTMYAHLDKVFVKPGDKLQAGQYMANLGNTGWSTGPHLHYEVRVRGKAINPLTLLFDDIHVKEKEILQTMLNQTNFKKWKLKNSKS